MNPEIEEEVLTSLGLTFSRVRVYLALVHNGPSKVMLISQVSGIHRTRPYQILLSFEETGFVERELGTGTYVAIPLKELAPILVKRRLQEIAKLETEVNEGVDRAPKRTPTLANKREIILTSDNHPQNKGQKHFEDARSQILCNVEMFRENGFSERSN